MHTDPVHIDIQGIIRGENITPHVSLKTMSILLVIVGAATWLLAFNYYDPKLLWGVYFSFTIFFTGLCLGGTILPAIFQVVRARWSAPVRRIYEAHSSFLVVSYCLIAGLYFGKQHLFPWANAPMPGREFWMQPNFAFARHLVCLGFLYFLLNLFVKKTLRTDIGLISEDSIGRKKLEDWELLSQLKNWKGSEIEIPKTQKFLSYFAPVVIFFYAVFVSLFAFEMIMGMDTIWFSNLFGAYAFIGFMYIAWCGTAILINYMRKTYPGFASQLGTQQYWDMGKLTFAFGMLWAYFTFAQFLVQWYGNLPEETQWLILRTRELPWRPIAWTVFGMCWVFPFIVLMSCDVKKTPWLYGTVSIVPFLGLVLQWLLVVIPQLSPESIPFHGGFLIVTILTFLGFLGGYLLCYFGFLSKYPYMAISSPMAKNSIKW